MMGSLVFLCVSLIAVTVISVAASSSQWDCPPPPGGNTRCGRSLTHPVDCHITGCPPGRLCCPINRCNEYRCLIAVPKPTYICPITMDYRCNPFPNPQRNRCETDQDCHGRLICCMVKCRKQCVRGIRIPPLSQ